MELKTLIAAWVREARDEAGLSGAALGAKLALELGTERGNTKANISHWETQKHSPSLQQLLAIAKVTGKALPPAILEALGGAAAPVDPITLIPGAMRVVTADRDDPSFVQIPLVRLRLSAGIMGFATEAEEHDGSTMSVRGSWIERNGYSPNKLIAIRVKGESMEPTLYDGDLVIINTADTKMVDGAVYAINYEGESVVKRMQREGGQWYLASDNQSPRFGKRICRGAECIAIGRVVRRESERI
jgi:phage repressor protein C with HTH and peptisase S24 domain